MWYVVAKITFTKTRQHFFACFLIYVSDVHFSFRNSPFEILKDSGCTVSAPVVKQMAQMDKAQIHVFADSVLCYGDSAMNESMEKFTKRWAQYFETAELLQVEKLEVSPAALDCAPISVRQKEKKRRSCVLKEAQNNAASFVCRGSKPGYSCSTCFQVARHFRFERTYKNGWDSTLHQVVLKESCSWA